jgi:sugar lactone lactonase YvrE
VTVHAWRKPLSIGLAAATIAAAGATGALGVSGSDTITTIAGTPLKRGFSGDGGPATAALLQVPEGVAVDRRGNVYIADRRNSRVRKVDASGTITTYAGRGCCSGEDFGDGGPATSARVDSPSGVALDGQGNLYIADGRRVRKVSPAGTITTIAGNGRAGGSCADGGPATSVPVNAWGVAVDGRGNVYMAEYSPLYCVRKISPSGTITTIAGTGKWGFSGDGGPATSAQIKRSFGVAVDEKGNVYFSDADNRRVRRVSSGGTITTVAGSGTSGIGGDGGPATSAQLLGPRGLAVDMSGNLYFADENRIRMVSGGRITTVAGRDPRLPAGEIGNGGPATAARLWGPNGVAFDGRGSLYIADTANNIVRKVASGSGATALTLTLGGASTQRLLAQKGITVTAKCSKPCSLSATGSVTIVGTKYVLGLTRASAGLSTGKRTLTLHCSDAQLKRFQQLFKPGQQARALVTVKARDKTGRTASSKRTVAVR